MKMMQRLPKQNAELHRLLSLLELNGVKEEMAIGYSDGRTSHTSELTMQECQELINRLKQMDEEKHKKSRNTVIHYLKLLGYDIDFVKKLSANPKGKSLNNLGGQALNKVVSQVKAIYKKETVQK